MLTTKAILLEENLTVWPLVWHRFHRPKMMVRIHPLSFSNLLCEACNNLINYILDEKER